MRISSILNVLAVGIFGEAEFWLSGGKVLLIFILFGFTFVTMVGGNPQGDAYGFSHWNDGITFVQYYSSDDKGRLEGFMGALATAAFVVVGPDYISMVAAEAKHPSLYIKSAFKTVYFRFGLFFIGGAIACTIVLPQNDLTLNAIYIESEGGGKSAAASPYVIAMENMGIEVLPHIVNALLFTTIFSAGNTYTYCATRSLYSLALEGRAPAILRECNSKGVPVWCFCVVMLFPRLSFLPRSKGSAEALNILLSLITGGGIVDYIVMSITFLFYYRACQAQGVDRRTRPYYGYFQPYGAWVALVVQIVVVYTYGYRALVEGDAKFFFSNYTMQVAAPVLFIGWKLLKRTKLVKPHEADLIWDRPTIDSYEARAMETDPPMGFWKEIGLMFGIGRKKRVVERQEEVKEGEEV